MVRYTIEQVRAWKPDQWSFDALFWDESARTVYDTLDVNARTNVVASLKKQASDLTKARDASLRAMNQKQLSVRERARQVQAVMLPHLLAETFLAGETTILNVETQSKKLWVVPSNVDDFSKMAAGLVDAVYHDEYDKFKKTIGTSDEAKKSAVTSYRGYQNYLLELNDFFNVAMMVNGVTLRLHRVTLCFALGVTIRYVDGLAYYDVLTLPSSSYRTQFKIEGNYGNIGALARQALILPELPSDKYGVRPEQFWTWNQFMTRGAVLDRMNTNDRTRVAAYMAYAYRYFFKTARPYFDILIPEDLQILGPLMFRRTYLDALLTTIDDPQIRPPTVSPPPDFKTYYGVTFEIEYRKYSSAIQKQKQLDVPREKKRYEFLNYSADRFINNSAVWNSSTQAVGLDFMLARIDAKQVVMYARDQRVGPPTKIFVAMQDPEVWKKYAPASANVPQAPAPVQRAKTPVAAPPAVQRAQTPVVVAAPVIAPVVQRTQTPVVVAAPVAVPTVQRAQTPVVAAAPVVQRAQTPVVAAAPVVQRSQTPVVAPSVPKAPAPVQQVARPRTASPSPAPAVPRSQTLVATSAQPAALARAISLTPRLPSPFSHPLAKRPQRPKVIPVSVVVPPAKTKTSVSLPSADSRYRLDDKGQWVLKNPSSRPIPKTGKGRVSNAQKNVDQLVFSILDEQLESGVGSERDMQAVIDAQVKKMLDEQIGGPIDKQVNALIKKKKK